MKFDINTLKRSLCAVMAMGLLALATLTTAQAQRRYRAYGDPQNYGQQRRARVHYRNNVRRDLKRHQKFERQALKSRIRSERETFGNSRDLRWRQRNQREALRLHQRAEKRSFKQTFKNRHRGH